MQYVDKINLGRDCYSLDVQQQSLTISVLENYQKKYSLALYAIMCRIIATCYRVHVIF